jgi:polyhydroxybutyrate depolymerase
VRTRLAGLVLASALLAACGGGGGSDKSGPTVRAAPSAGCHKVGAVAPGQEKVTFPSGGTDRWYIRHVPVGYAGTKPGPVVFDFHGYFEGADIEVRMSGLGPFGDERGFVTITPQSLGPVPLWNTTLGSADLAFFGDLLDQVESTLCVDTNRVFVGGLSDGAFMTSAIACAYADRVAAVAPVAGIRDIRGCAPARPVPVVAFHGTADPFVSFDGGLGPAVAKLPAPDGSGRTLGDLGVSNVRKGPSIAEVTAAWAKRNGCASNPSEARVANDVTLVRYRCPNDATVELYRIDGGGHAWPGSEVSKAIAAVVGPTTFSISANDIIWKFFESHPLRGAKEERSAGSVGKAR